MLRKYFKRLTAGLLCVLMIIQFVPAYAINAELIKNAQTEEELRLAIMGDSKWTANHPNGLFNFIESNMSIHEDLEFYEFAIARQGGTSGAVSVDIKAIDVSAEYGVDYIIRVKEGKKTTDIPADPNSMPMLYTLGDTADINLSASQDDDETQFVSDEIITNEDDIPEPSADTNANATVDASVTESNGDAAFEEDVSVTESNGDAAFEEDASVTESNGDADSEEDASVTESNGDADSEEDTSVTESNGDADSEEDTSVTESDGDSAENDETTDTQDEIDVKYTEFVPVEGTQELSVSEPVSLSLREAKEIYTGTESDRPNWMEADADTVESLKEAYDETFGNLPGAMATLHFEDGEYIKYLQIIPIKSDISRSERQVMLMLNNPTGGSSRGEFYMAQFSIVDDKGPENARFEIEDTYVTADGSKATVTVKRSGGLGQYAWVYIGTEESSAISNADYVPGLRELFFIPGMERQTVSVDILDNPYRNEERTFTIALDRENENVVLERAAATVVIPAMQDVQTAEEISATYQAELEVSALSEISPKAAITSAEKISLNGYSGGTGKWIMPAADFVDPNAGYRVGGLIESNYWLRFSHTGGGQWAHNTTTKLYGVNNISFNWGNNGYGKDYWSWFEWHHETRYSLTFEIRGSTSHQYNWELYGSQGTWTATTRSFNQTDESLWNTARIGFYSWAYDGNSTFPYVSPVTLNLRPYTVRTTTPSNLSFMSYPLNSNGTLGSGSASSSFAPGTISIRNVVSNVSNSKTVNSTSTTAYRSDLINFDVNYSAINKDGLYALYDGFQVMNGSTVVATYRGSDQTQLFLNSAFFQKSGILDAIRAGTITIRPIFVKNTATLRLTNSNTTLGSYSNSGFTQSGNTAYRNITTTICVGDKVTGIKAVPNATSRKPSWSAQISENINGSYPKNNNTGIKVTDTTGSDATVDVTLLDRYTNLSLAFANPVLTVQANPTTYAERTTSPVYTIDGTKYTTDTESNYEKLRTKMQDVFNKNQNPTITMTFDLYFNPNFPNISTRKAAFGNPKSAMVTVYKADGTTRDTWTIDKYSNGFSLSGKLKDFGWELSDTASVTIYGSNTIGGRVAQTSEIVVDFLYNEQNSVMIQSQNGTLLGTGTIFKPAEIKNASPLEKYQMYALASTEFTTRWGDMSADTNGDGSETITEAEQAVIKLRALGFTGNIDEARRKDVYHGNYFFIQPSFFETTKIYYDFVKRTTGTSGGTISVKLVNDGGTVLDPAKSVTGKPIQNASVVILGKEIPEVAGSPGEYFDIDPNYSWGEHYLGKVYLGGYEFDFEVIGNGSSEVKINPMNIMPPKNFSVTLPGSSTDPFKNGSRQLNIVSGTTSFKYSFSNNSTGISPNKSIIRFYEGNEVKYRYETGAPSGGIFTFNVDTLQVGIKPGMTMSIAGVYTEVVGGQTRTQEFPEVHVGLVFRQSLGVLDVAASFDTPFSGAIKLFGKIDNAFDLGANVNLEDKFTINPYTDGQGRAREQRIVSFGFNKTFEKEFSKASEDSGDEDGGEDSGGEDEGEEPTFVEKLIKPIAGDVGAMRKEVNKAQETASDPAAKKGSGEGSVNLEFKVSLSIILESGVSYNEMTDRWQSDGHDYFSALVIMASADGSASYEYSYITPIGIPIMASAQLSGQAVMTFGMEAQKSDPFAQKYMLSGEGSLSLDPSNYSYYLKFVVQPTITLGAGVGFSFLNLWVHGNAEFDFEFMVPIYGDNHDSSGSGGVTFSAELSVKILIIKHKWTLYKSDYINLFSYGRAAPAELLNMIANPYNDYMYESLGGGDVLTREYLSEKSGWLSSPAQARAIRGITENTEQPLITNAYPYPQTKMLPFGDDKTLMLFIDDDANRDDLNRARLMYSIGANGTWSPPQPVDDDGTWDESPDAFSVDGQIFITWTDAGRLFIDSDDEISMLKAMNISGKWFDTVAGELVGGKVEITKTVTNGDNCADLQPKVSYDEDKERLMVYFTKIDYDDTGRPFDDEDTEATESIPQEDEALFGDIVNGYNVVAYRYADKQDGTFVWNETYEPGEGFDGPLAEQWYGQRFLDLAVPATINTTVTTTPIPGDFEGLIAPLEETWSQTAVYNPDNPSDPRVVDFDLITYNGLGLFAYTVDFDANIKTTNDQKLYMQIYNYAENSFSHPILLSDDGTQNSAPQFVRAKEVTYLYWIKGGDIVYLDITNLIRNDCLTEVSLAGAPSSVNDKMYVIDLSRTGENGGQQTAIAQGEDNPIGEFHIQSNEQGIYIVWPQYVISYKNGLQPGEPGTEDLDNIIKERQLFGAFTDPGYGLVDGEYDTHDPEEGGTPYYSEGYAWSSPVQITFDTDASYSDISLVVTEDNDLLVSYIRFNQELSEDRIFVSNELNRTLGVKLISIESTPGFGEIEFVEDHQVMGGDLSQVKMDITNTGIMPMYGEYRPVITIDGEDDYTGEWIRLASSSSISGRDYILGGHTESIYHSFELPINLRGTEVGFDFRTSSDEYSMRKPVIINDEIDILINNAALIEENRAEVYFTLINNGNVDFNDTITIETNGTELYSETISLPISEQKEFVVEIDITGHSFSPVTIREDGSIFDTLNIIITAGDSELEQALVREAGKEIADAISSVSSFSLTFDDKTVEPNSTISMDIDSWGELKAIIERYTDLTEETVDPLEVVWSSSANNVAVVLDDGNVVPLSTGSTVITATLRPNTSLIRSYSTGGYDILDESYLMPDGVIKNLQFTLNVTTTSQPPVTPDPGTSTGSTNVPAEKTVEILINGQTSTVKEDQNGVLQIVYTENDVAKYKDDSGSFVIETAQSEDISLSIPTATLVDDDLVIKTIFGTLTVPSAALKSLGGTLRLAIKKGSFIVAMHDQSGDEITYNDPENPLGLSLPYTLESGQLEEAVVAVMADGTIMPYGVYKDDYVTFNIASTGTYDVIYNAKEFPDITGHWAYDYINFTAARALYQGNEKGEFMPNGAMTRAMFVQVLANAEQVDLTEYEVSRFSDVAVSAWYAPAVEWAADMGVVSGVGNDMFDPNSNITREQMAVMLDNFIKYKGFEYQQNSALDEFTDEADISLWALDSVKAIQAAGIISGKPGGLFDPKTVATRSEAATVFAIFIEKSAS